MDGPLPLPALLSHTLVAFTIEFDNEFEHQMPHRTTNHGSTSSDPHAPWLVSMAMWANFMRFVPTGGIHARDLQGLLGTKPDQTRLWVRRMGKWWGYVEVAPGAIVRPTIAGRQAQKIWQSVLSTIEKRWEKRFGKQEIAGLRESLRTLAGKLDPGVPESLPILGYGLFSRAPAALVPDKISGLGFPGFLAKILLAFAIEFERDAEVSLAIGANVLRFADKDDIPIRDLPALAGISKEAVAMCVSFLEKRGYAVVQAVERAKMLSLTAKGLRARALYSELVWKIEDRWRTDFGKDVISGLRERLELLVGQPTAELSPLLRGLEPYPDGWRASFPRPKRLPYYPMVLHRGGYPDGS